MKLIKEFFRFIGVGFIMLLFSITASYILLEIFELPLYPSYISLYLIAIFLSYYLNSKFTFDKKQNLRLGLQYYAVYLVGLIIGLGLLKICESLFDYSNFILTILIIIPRTILTYIMMKLLLFADSV